MPYAVTCRLLVLACLVALPALPGGALLLLGQGGWFAQQSRPALLSLLGQRPPILGCRSQHFHVLREDIGMGACRGQDLQPLALPVEDHHALVGLEHGLEGQHLLAGAHAQAHA